MIKNIITSKNTDYSTFLQCDCGSEILWFYYYHGTTTCEEIIGVDYFGYLKKKENSLDKHFNFSAKQFKIFLQDLKNIQHIEEFCKDYECNGSYIRIKKDSLGFYSIFKFKDRKFLFKGTYVWDIKIRSPQLIELINELNEMEKVIDYYNKKVEN